MDIDIDKTDIQIMQMLQEDGRASLTDIANVLGISHGTVRNRIARLQECKLLRIVGWVNPLAAGYRSPANIQIAVEPPNLIPQVAASLAEMPETSFVAGLTGEFDLYVDVRCRDMDHLYTFVAEKIHPLEGVARTRVNLFMHVYKYGPSAVVLDPTTK